MSLSQTYPANYASVLYPGPSGYQENILPKIADTGMGGNSADYTSKAVGGARRTIPNGPARRKSRRKMASRKWRGSGRDKKKSKRGTGKRR